MIGAAVAGQVQCNNVEMFTKQRRQAVERRRVVEPAVQGEQARQRRIAPGARRQAQMRQGDGNLAHRVMPLARRRRHGVADPNQPARVRADQAASSRRHARGCRSAPECSPGARRRRR